MIMSEYECNNEHSGVGKFLSTTRSVMIPMAEKLKVAFRGSDSVRVSIIHPNSPLRGQLTVGDEVEAIVLGDGTKMMNFDALTLCQVIIRTSDDTKRQLIIANDSPESMDLFC
mmetsp:Transcript_17237/g.19208  ORF Transcript_17237/g.19208 Transcript_17237/m.19208 type:complete len:113 (+) Transcript_17237:87-425(+)